MHYLLLLFLCGISFPSLAEVISLRPQTTAALYINNTSESETLSINIKTISHDEPERLLIRLYDEDENEVSKRLYLHNVSAGGGGVWCVFDLTFALINYHIDKCESKAEFPVFLNLNSKGVWQVRLVAWESNTELEIETTDSLKFGVSAIGGSYPLHVSHSEYKYLYIPVAAKLLELDNSGFTLSSLDGVPVNSNSTENGGLIWNFGKNDVGRVYQLQRTQPGSRNFRSTGVPVILFSDPNAAAAVKGSVEICKNGSFVAHKFQLDICDRIDSLSSEDLSMLVRNANTLAEGEAERFRESILYNPMDGVLASIDAVLSSQNLDASSPYFGSFYKDHPRASFLGVFNFLNIPKDSWGGVSSINSAAATEILAINYLYKKIGNNLYRNNKLLHRILLSFYRDSLALGESEELPHGGPKFDFYPGYTAFVMGRKFFPPFYLIVDELSEADRELWERVITRLVDRSGSEKLLSTRNQSSHILYSLALAAYSSDDVYFKNMFNIFQKIWLQGESEAGYQMEAGGPSGSYQGMTNWHVAMAARISGVNELITSIDRAYNFFNHTVAVEPNGITIGASNFSHRIGDSFVNEQWDGARGIASDLVESVGVWKYICAPSCYLGLKTNASLHSKIERDDKYSPARYNINWPRWLFWTSMDNSGVEELPIFEEGPFERVFGHEMLAVKRKAYYVTVYFGTPAKGLAHLVYRNQIEENWLDDLQVDPSVSVPFNGGGISLLWSQEAGAILVSSSWGGFTHQGLVLQNQGGTARWEDYDSVSHEIVDKNSLLVSGRIRGTPVTYERRYFFGEDYIDVHVSMSLNGFTFSSSIKEVFPMPDYVHNVKKFTSHRDGSMKKIVFKLLESGEKAFEISWTGLADPDIIQTKSHRGVSFSALIFDLLNAQIGDKSDFSYRIKIY